MTIPDDVHFGRSWGDGRAMEDGCPCPKEPCGLVRYGNLSPDCDQHPMERLKSIRQSHPAGKCPGVRPETVPVRLSGGAVFASEAAAYFGPDVLRRLNEGGRP